MLEKIYLLKIYYETEIEEATGVVDFKKRIIRLLDINNNYKKGFREIGFINFDFIKKLEVIKSVGCIGNKNNSDVCYFGETGDLL